MASAVMGGTSWLAMLLNAPICGVHPNATVTRVVHALTIDQVPLKRATGTSACGKRGIKAMGLTIDGPDKVLVAPFPPQKRGLPNGLVRCDECWLATGKKRPRIKVTKGGD